MARIATKAKAPTISDVFADGVSLATTYFEDGAPFSAARVLRETADKLQAHGEAFNRALEVAAMEPARK